MERGNAKHGPREDDALADELRGTLGPGGANREEWTDPEPPADDDPPARTERPGDDTDDTGVAAGPPAPHDLDVANDWHRPG